MFNLRAYIKKGFLDAVGKMSDYQIILNSVGWMEKGVLTEDDLEEINTKIEAQYPVIEEPVVEEEVTEEPVIEDEVTEPEEPLLN